MDTVRKYLSFALHTLRRIKWASFLASLNEEWLKRKTHDVERVSMKCLNKFPFDSIHLKWIIRC